MTLLSLLLVLLALPAVAVSAYLLVLSSLALATAKKPPPTPPPPALRFAVLIPAHDEAATLTATVQSCLAVDWPRPLFTVHVLADNCTDATASLAKAAGAWVLERRDETRRGKGYALAFAFEALLAGKPPDAFVVVDADTLVSPNLLQAFAARLGSGAQAVQAHYTVRNPRDSWRTRLLTIALALFHRARGLGREALGVSCGLRGNGMGFTTSLLREVPYGAFSLVEDVEYGLALGRAGHRVAYADEAQVAGEMVAGERASRSQRRRWEDGRRALAKKHGWPLLGRGLLSQSLLLVDLALDVLVPPLSRVASWTALGLLASLGAFLALGAGGAALALFAFAAAGLTFAVLAGWWLSGTGGRGLLDLAFAPAYVAWKLALALGRPAARAEGDWVRTTRAGEPRP